MSARVPRPPGGQFDRDWYLRERFAGPGRASRTLSAFYAVKPLIPRRVQMALRRAYAPAQARGAFPRWPIEPLLVEQAERELGELGDEAPDGRHPLVAPWPDGARFAVVLTHDVEGPAGVANVRRVREVERRHGFASAWNFVGDDYAIPDGLFDELRAEGCEIGLHGLSHDGKLFGSREQFEAQLPEIRARMAEWGAVGFRSPALHRNADWMPELGCLYDSSFPDTDPFNPQAGGCCWVFPYFLDDLVELPVTLTQDYVLFDLLRTRSIELWTDKCEWLIEHHGLVNPIVHPDYVVEDEPLAMYEELLVFLAGREGAWRALPREVAQWWRDRREMGVEPDGRGGHRVTGDPTGRARVAYARRAGERVVLEAA